MNIREGFRRVGVAVGFLGACVGVAFSIVNLDAIRTQRYQYEEFEALLNSHAVQKAIHDLKAAAQKSGPWEEYAKSGPINNPTPSAGWELEPRPFNAFMTLKGASDGWPIIGDAVKRIYFGSDQQVNSITDSDMRRLYRTTSPHYSREYLLLFVWPIIGFFAPWLLLTGLRWVIVGFISGAAEQKQALLPAILICAVSVALLPTSLHADDDAVGDFLTAKTVLELQQKQAAAVLRSDKLGFEVEPSSAYLWILSTISADQACQNFTTWASIDYYSAADIAANRKIPVTNRLKAMVVGKAVQREADRACRALRDELSKYKKPLTDETGNLAADATTQKLATGELIHFSKAQIETALYADKVIKMFSESEDALLNRKLRSEQDAFTGR